MAVQNVHVTGEWETSFQDTSRKRKGSAAFNRYETYKKAKTVVEFWDLGGTQIDLEFDYKKGLVSLVDPNDKLLHRFGKQPVPVAQIAPARELPHDAPPMAPILPEAVKSEAKESGSFGTLLTREDWEQMNRCAQDLSLIAAKLLEVTNKALA